MKLRSVQIENVSGLESFIKDSLKKKGFVAAEVRIIFGFDSNGKIQIQAEIGAETKKKEIQILRNLQGLDSYIETFLASHQPPPDTNFKIQSKIIVNDPTLKPAQAVHSPSDVFESRKADKVRLNFRKELYREFAGSEDPQIYRRKKYGKEIAEKFFDHLQSSGGFYSSHKGYCGTGFFFDSKTTSIRYATVYEGWPDQILKTFQSKMEFVDWFSQQSDESLSMKEHNVPFLENNQTITYELISWVLKK